jgi:hypothetical protein
MLSEAKKYHGYAPECVRLAGRAETPELRDKLIELARVWMDADRKFTVKPNVVRGAQVRSAADRTR